MADNERAQLIPLEKLLTGLLAIAIAERDDRLKESEPRRSEVILSEAGFSIAEVAALTGRKYETVKSALRRSKPGPAKRDAKASTEEN